MMMISGLSNNISTGTSRNNKIGLLLLSVSLCLFVNPKGVVGGFVVSNTNNGRELLKASAASRNNLDNINTDKDDVISSKVSSSEVSRRDFSSRMVLASGGGWLSGSFGSGISNVGAAAAAEGSASSVMLGAGVDAGIEFPLASFGLQVYDDEKAYRLTMTALEVGYRNFFASVLAGNQRGFAKAVKDSGIPRKELFICGSVVSNRAQGYKDAYAATTKGWKQNMDIFSTNGNIDYLDQIMLDYPGPDCESIQGQWAAFQDMHSQKLVRTLAVSNFSPTQLDCILNDKKNTKVLPLVNQLPFSVAYHPPYPGGLSAQEIVKANADRGVLVQAWAPLGYSLGGKFTSQMKDVCQQIGKPYGKSYAQVALRWIVQTGASFTTQTTKKSHFVEDLNIFDFTLSPQDMILLDGLYKTK